MKFDDFDKKMRVFETEHDHCVLPGIYMVARLDGRNFTTLTKETCNFEAPFDDRFRDYMIETTKHLMTCGFRILYGYTESDEISLLFHPEEDTFGRKTRKLLSVLAGEASAKFSLLIGQQGIFDCRISELSSLDLVVDYFRWRNEDAHRNALNAHCYWMLIKHGESARAATSFLLNKTISAKNEFLFENGLNFNNIPNWQKRGVGLFWEIYEKDGKCGLTGELLTTERKRIKIDMDLPMKNDYSEFIRELFNKESIL